jgi:uncharacterized protein (DUF488 family)
MILSTKPQRKARLVAKKSNREESKPDVFTIGHSTRNEEEFLDLLKTRGVTHLVDIRTIPKSRRNPQFSQDFLSKFARNAGIRYTHLKGLGGLRHSSKESINTGWRNSSFRGFADYMQTSEFTESLNELTELISRESKRGGRVAYMCAEAVPWRCHRSLVSDALTIRGFRVAHILSRRIIKDHEITSFAVVRGRKITYPSSRVISTSLMK